MTRRGVIVLLIGGVVLLAGCGSLSPARYRFRMTVEVETPQGIRSGSSVLEVTSQLQNLPGQGITPLTMLTGEAVAVDLPGGRTLFALIGDLPSGDDLEGEVTKLFEPGAIRPEEFVASVEKLGRSDQVGRVAQMPSEHYPQFATFRDIGDPKSIEVVDPRNLGANFGPGVKLRGVAVTITHDDVTTGIKKRLGYGRAENGFADWYRSLPFNDDRRIGPENFYRGT